MNIAESSWNTEIAVCFFDFTYKLKWVTMKTDQAQLNVKHLAVQLDSMVTTVLQQWRFIKLQFPSIVDKMSDIRSQKFCTMANGKYIYLLNPAFLLGLNVCVCEPCLNRSGMVTCFHRSVIGRVLFRFCPTLNWEHVLALFHEVTCTFTWKLKPAAKGCLADSSSWKKQKW